MQFIKVTLAIKPDICVIVPKNKIIDVRGSKLIGSNSVITYENKGNISVIETIECVEDVYKMLNHA